MDGRKISLDAASVNSGGRPVKVTCSIRDNPGYVGQFNKSLMFQSKHVTRTVVIGLESSDLGSPVAPVNDYLIERRACLGSFPFKGKLSIVIVDQVQFKPVRRVQEGLHPSCTPCFIFSVLCTSRPDKGQSQQH